MFILKTGHQPGVYVPLRALFLVLLLDSLGLPYNYFTQHPIQPKLSNKTWAFGEITWVI